MNLLKNELPEAWCKTSFADIADIGTGNPAPQGEQFFNNGIYPFVRVQDMGRLGMNKYVTDTADHINELAIKKLKYFPKGTVLFTKSGASSLLNQRALLKSDMYVVSHIATVVPSNGISSDYLYYWLKTIDFNHIAHATTLPSIPLSKVYVIEISLASTEEQNQIVNVLEALFSDLDNAIENLKKAQEQLKIYRQAVLKNAFEGRLTNVVKESDLREIKINGLPAKLYSTQNVKRLGEYVKLQGGFAFKSKEYTVDGVPIVKITNVHYGDIDWSDKTFIDSSRYGEFKDYQLREGDVLLAMTRPIIKSLNTVKTVVVKKKDLPSLLNQRVGRFILNVDICRDYLRYFLYTDYFKQRVLRESSSTQQPNISSKDIEDFDFIVPENKTAQELIIKEIESRFSVCDNLEGIIIGSLNQAETLRQSILKQAFDGKLTEQWRKDHKDLIFGENSAEALLKKIKAEKEALQNKPKGRKKHD